MATAAVKKENSGLSKRAQLKRDKVEDRRKSRVPEGQISQGGSNLGFDDIQGNNSGANNQDINNKKDSNFKNKNSSAVDNKDDGQLNFRQVMAREKKRQQKKKKKSQKKSAVYQGSKAILRGAWTSLIPSWFMSIFVIDAMAFSHMVFPKFFAPLGSEWESPMANVADVNTKVSAKSVMMKTVEPLIVILINILALALILIIVVALIIMIIITNPWILGWAAIAELWDIIGSAF